MNYVRCTTTDELGNCILYLNINKVKHLYLNLLFINYYLTTKHIQTKSIL